ncbi:hypothetical protein IFM89_006101 [Coptis chinensis]|uniref:Myb/SANT-like domain-containing protein n=1 Tax=Coptis chinensis TaxID=261450 RepID=A0A835GXS5_9MAGN|nr:hypothetical protein IFM89_006101 [Coptis chinensis]
MASPQSPDLSSIFEGRFPRKRRSCSHDCHVIQNPIGNVNTLGLPDIQNLGDSIGNAKNQVLADEPSGDPIEIVNTQGLPVIRKKLGDSIWYVSAQGLPDLQNLGDSIGNAKNQALADEPSGDPIRIVNTQGLPGRITFMLRYQSSLDESLCPSKAQTHLGDMKTHLERFPVQSKFNGSWLFDMDVVAFKTLYEEYMKGNKLVKGDLNMYLVNRILEKVERETGEYLTLDSVQRRLSWHANSVRDVRALANKAKFVWNAEECKLDADEEAWKEEFRENPSSIFLYNEVFPFYDYIVHLFPSFKE